MEHAWATEPCTGVLLCAHPWGWLCRHTLLLSQPPPHRAVLAPDLESRENKVGLGAGPHDRGTSQNFHQEQVQVIWTKPHGVHIAMQPWRLVPNWDQLAASEPRAEDSRLAVGLDKRWASPDLPFQIKKTRVTSAPFICHLASTRHHVLCLQKPGEARSLRVVEKYGQ